MAERADKTVWVLTLLAAGLGSGALGRHLLGRADDGLLFWALFAAGLLLLGLPLLLAEAAFGQFRRRNIGDAFGPGPWRIAGWAKALLALPLAALLAYLAAIAARVCYDSLFGGYEDDPERYWRLATQGWDALLLTAGAIVTAMAFATGGARTGLRGAMTAVGAVGALAVGALAVYAYASVGGTAREAALAFDLDGLEAPLVVQALQQALVPGLVGFGLVATLSAHVHDRTLPRESVLIAVLWALVAGAGAVFLGALAQQEGIGLDDGFGLLGAVKLFAAIGGTQGGVLAGTFFGILLAGSLAALVAVLEVPATLVAERVVPFGEGRANFGAGLIAYLMAVPLCFVRGAAADLGLVLTAVVAPLGGLLVALHVGWARPQVLDGFVVGDARHRLDRFLRPVLRYVLPLPLLALLVVGALQASVAFGAEAGSGALWRLVP